MSGNRNSASSFPEIFPRNAALRSTLSGESAASRFAQRAVDQWDSALGSNPAIRSRCAQVQARVTFRGPSSAMCSDRLSGVEFRKPSAREDCSAAEREPCYRLRERSSRVPPRRRHGVRERRDRTRRTRADLGRRRPLRIDAARATTRATRTITARTRPRNSRRTSGSLGSMVVGDGLMDERVHE